MDLRYLTAVILCLLAACTTPAAPGSAPSAPDGTVAVRLVNQSAVDFSDITLTYPSKNDTRITIPTLRAGSVSDPFTVTEVFQSAAIELTAAGRQYRVEALDIAAEPPITSGAYRYVLTLANGNLIVDFQPDTAAREQSLDSLVGALEAVGGTVIYEQSIPRETLFDRLWGQPVTRPELLQVDGQRVWVYQFDNEAAAQAAAGAIQPGGTSLIYTRPGGTVAREFVGGVGSRLRWWRWGPFILQLGEFLPADTPTIELISRALNQEPLQSDSLAGSDVQLRLANLSGVDFERVTVNVNGRETEYGPLPAGKVSAYFPQNGAYRYAGITVLAEGESHQFLPIDFVGETPLAPGNYTYVLDVANGFVSIVHLNDDTPATDPALLGKWFWSSAQRADGTFMTPEGYEGQQPYIEFTEMPDPNQAGFLFTGFGGCNGLGGGYLASPDGQGFVTAGVAMTAQDCGAPYMESEGFLQEALSGVVNYTVDGETLTFYIPTGETVTFTRG